MDLDIEEDAYDKTEQQEEVVPENNEKPESVQQKSKAPKRGDQKSIDEISLLECEGLGGARRRGQLKDLVSFHHPDVVYLQETIKREFSDHLLKDLVNGQHFSWTWTEAEGHSGGTLTGVKEGDIEVISHDEESFFSSIQANRKDDVVWEVINVYGPVQNERKQNFLEELANKINNTQCSFIIGGDFNLIRYASEKSTLNIDQCRMDLFNTFISETGIKEVARKGSRFT